MKVSLSRELAYWLIIILCFIGFSQFARAWTAPGGSPPAGNVSGPLTVGAGSQTKASGDINLSGGGSLYAGGVVAAPSLCIGADCRAVWPTGGGGGGTVGGSGTTNYIPYWTASGTLGDSPIHLTADVYKQPIFDVAAIFNGGFGQTDPNANSYLAGALTVGLGTNRGFQVYGPGNFTQGVTASGFATSGQINAGTSIMGSSLCIGSDCRSSWPASTTQCHIAATQWSGCRSFVSAAFEACWVSVCDTCGYCQTITDTQMIRATPGY